MKHLRADFTNEILLREGGCKDIRGTMSNVHALSIRKPHVDRKFVESHGR